MRISLPQCATKGAFMKLTISCKIGFKEFALPAWIYIPNAGNDWIKISCSDSKVLSICVGHELIQKIREGTVIDCLSKALTDESELKKRLIGSSFLPVLKRRVKELSPLDQMKVLAHYLIFANPSIIHFKMPSSLFGNFNPALVELLLRYLSSLQCSILWEDPKNGLEAFFIHFKSQTSDEAKLPGRLEELSWFESLPFHPFKGQLKATGSNLAFELGDLTLDLDTEDFPSLLGLVNQDLILCLSDESFDTSRKDKKDYIKLNLQSQTKKGLLYHQVFIFESIPFCVKSTRRSATPFLFVKLDLNKVYIFHPQTGERLFPVN